MSELDENDRQEMMAGAGMAAALCNMAQLKTRHGNFTEEDGKKFEKDILSMLIPQSYKNISAEKLKKMLVDDYLQQASIAMMSSFKDRRLLFPVKKTDEDIIHDLQKNWLEQKIKSEIDEKTIIHDKVECIVVTLIW